MSVTFSLHLQCLNYLDEALKEGRGAETGKSLVNDISKS